MAYIRKKISNFGLNQAKESKIPLDTGYEKQIKSNFLPDNDQYQQLVGCLLYLAINTRPDIAASISILAREVSRPSYQGWSELRRVLKYLKGTCDLKLSLSRIELQKENSALYAFADANWAECASDRKSNSGYVIMLYDDTIDWMCRKQSCVANLVQKVVKGFQCHN